MYESQHLFDILLRPAIENSMARSVQFVLDESQKALWAYFVQPKIIHCTAYAKVREPH